MPGLDPCQTLDALLATMRTLRAPGGCPWDAEQTPESLAPYILEEACEVIEAIEGGSADAIADELGDLLLQVVFQADIHAERGAFDFADIAAGINAKLLRRHPHVFGDTRHEDPSTRDLIREWERIKREEAPGHLPAPHPLGRLPETLPALQRAQKLVGRARRTGITTDEFGNVGEERRFLTEEQLGGALFTLVQQAESSGLDAEQALRKTVRKVLISIRNNP